MGAHELDTAWVRRSFDRSAGTYDAAAVLQTEVRGILLKRLDLTEIEPRVVLDAGAGTGHGSRALRRRYPKALVIALDSSLGMLKAAASQRAWLRPFLRLCADASQLPLKDGSVDLIFSNCLLPWIDLDAAFGEFRRVLAPRGLLTFSSLGPDTLSELRRAWRGVDSHARVHPFIDMHDVGDALVRAGFEGPVLDVERYTLEYPDARALALDLKAMGAHNAAAARLKGLTGRGKFLAMQAAYELRRRNGRLPATCEVVFGQAWTPVAARARPDDGGSVSLDEMKRQLKTNKRPS